MASTKTTKTNKTKDSKDKKTTSKPTPQATGPTPLQKIITFWKEMTDYDHEGGADGMTKAEITRFCLGAILCLASCFMLLSIISHIFTGHLDARFDYEHVRASNWMGAFGLYTARFFNDRCWGVASLFIPLFLLVSSLRAMKIYKVRLWKWFLNCAVLMIWSSVFMATCIQPILPESTFINLGGSIGQAESDFLRDKFGDVGIYFILIVSLIAYLIYLSEKTIGVIRKVLSIGRYDRHHPDSDSEMMAGEQGEDTDPEDAYSDEDNGEEDINNTDQSFVQTATTIEFTDITDQPHDSTPNDAPIEMEITAPEDSPAEPQDDTSMIINQGTPEEEARLGEDRTLEPYDPKLDLENYKYPTLDLLKHYNIDSTIDMDEQQANKNRIIQVLLDFGVKIVSIKATVGPTITLYEITPAPGVRISKIRNLEDDIALSLSALGIRIIAPIPGKGTIGIEVPNAKPQIVSMESICNSRKFQETTFELPIALGKTITNEIYMADLAKMPHLLVAGATGQGKSVGLNAIITSLLYKKHPAELKLVMVDPKKVEFSVYNPIVNHFLAQVEGNEGEEPIITDVQKVVQTLKSLCVEMDERYDLLKKAGARNLREYNEKFKSRHLNPDNGHRFMPYIVVVIDEFGDLIMTAGKEIELPICRIAQLARAVGIHMIIATQRPTTNIITGTIKANFPARMAFKVSAMIDSRTILDRGGAQQLVGKGDMLILNGAEPVRVQCAFVDTPEVEAITRYIACQQSYLGPAPLPPVPMDGDDAGPADADMQNLDPMFEEVARLVVQTQQGSTSMIQRKFSIGYNRAGRLMDQLEVAGIVGPAHGSKPREVLVQGDVELLHILDGLK